MSNEFSFLIVPVAGIGILVLIQVFIDDKLRKILYSREEDHNPKGLDRFRRKMSPGKYLKMIKEDAEYRKGIDLKLGELYWRTYIFIHIMMVLFTVLLIFVFVKSIANF